MLPRRDLALESIGKALRMEFCEGKREHLISGDLLRPHFQRLIVNNVRHDGIDAPVLRQVDVCAPYREVVKRADELLSSGLWQPHVLDDRHPRDHAGDLDPTAFEDRTCVGALDQAVGNPAKSARPPPTPRLVDAQQFVDLLERQLSDIRGWPASRCGALRRRHTVL